MKLLIVLLLALTTLSAYAEPDNTCWGDPVNIAVVGIDASDFPSNKKGTEVSLWYQTTPDTFSGVCNRSFSGLYIDMTHYIDMGDGLVPSELNSGYFKLSDDVDIRIRYDRYYFPVVPPAARGKTVPPIGHEVIRNDFSVAGSGWITFKLRRDIIGGGIVVPSDTVLFSAYRVMNIRPFPPRPSRPLLQARTRAGGQVVPVTPVCSINQGNVIEVNFRTLQTDQVASRSDGERYSKDIALRFSCNTSLTQDIKVQLVADSAGFSSDLIRSDNNALGFALKYRGQLVPPMSTFPARLDGGNGSENITLTPVKDSSVLLQAGAFNASAILIISAI